jgi:hypothetical protein
VGNELSPAKRIVLVGYGLAVALVFTWVPWRGGLEVRGGNRDSLGYGLVWSPPKPPPLSLEYEAARDAYLKAPPSNSATGSLGFIPSPQYTIVPPSPKRPEGYVSTFVYKSATVDYVQVLLEFSALTGLGIAAWSMAGLGLRTGDREDAEDGEVVV